ncbi:cupin domain-containing protein [Aminobacter ciceronei]|uniref:Cupin superfamily protein n=1 Tax=Aminobacter ciceronei TaxID=150723 RepID=A0ABR6CGX3_9HYPH|nr:cupin domain-containing protein [Aminobacter ciceronei]MBA8910490.1 putative cupin superfamily protein [Aminobacter ciceronei]MBA9024278.1 putative cupin superfamily protein [Aminobacter ciceronei]
MPEKISALNADGISEPFAAEAAPLEVFSHGERFGSSFRHLSSFGGGDHVGVALEELVPGKEKNPSHYHMLEEEHAYILEGALTLKLGARNYVMKTGDYVCFPAGQKVGHAFFNHTDAPCRYLIIGERNPNDVIVYPESGRVSVRLTGEGYGKAATMDYWEGIDASAPDAKARPGLAQE